MVTDHMIRLKLSPAELQRLERIAAERGHQSVEEYLEAVVKELAEEADEK